MKHQNDLDVSFGRGRGEVLEEDRTYFSIKAYHAKLLSIDQSKLISCFPMDFFSHSSDLVGQYKVQPLTSHQYMTHIENILS